MSVKRISKNKSYDSFILEDGDLIAISVDGPYEKELKLQFIECLDSISVYEWNTDDDDIFSDLTGAFVLSGCAAEDYIWGRIKYCPDDSELIGYFLLINKYFPNTYMIREGKWDMFYEDNTYIDEDADWWDESGEKTGNRDFIVYDPRNMEKADYQLQFCQWIAEDGVENEPDITLIQQHKYPLGFHQIDESLEEDLLEALELEFYDDLKQHIDEVLSELNEDDEEDEDDDEDDDEDEDDYEDDEDDDEYEDDEESDDDADDSEESDDDEDIDTSFDEITLYESDDLKIEFFGLEYANKSLQLKLIFDCTNNSEYERYIKIFNVRYNGKPVGRKKIIGKLKHDFDEISCTFQNIIEEIEYNIIEFQLEIQDETDVLRVTDNFVIVADLFLESFAQIKQSGKVRILMKPIDEYNFREIVGKFVIIKNDFIERKYKYPVIAYCYIDYQEGISFREFGLYKEDGIETNDNEIVVSRYTDNLELGFFDSPTEEMENFAKDINEHTPEWLISLRQKKEFDKYRSKAFPDDILIPVRHITEEKKFVEELLWVRPVRYERDILTGLTIESGKKIQKGSLVIIEQVMMNGYEFMSITYELFEYYEQKSNQ